MNFKYSVIGDNSQENREQLEKVGYSLGTVICDDANIIVTEGDFYLLAYEHINKSNYINCIGNPPLFKAVSAMREDSDFGQLFECKGGLFICQYETSREHIDEECKGWNITNLKKLNLEKLQERFKL